MSRTRIPCLGCGYPTTLAKPVCDDCEDFFVGCRIDMGAPSKRSKPANRPETRGRVEAGSASAPASIPDKSATPVYPLADKSR